MQHRLSLILPTITIYTPNYHVVHIQQHNIINQPTSPQSYLFYTKQSDLDL